MPPEAHTPDIAMTSLASSSGCDLIVVAVGERSRKQISAGEAGLRQAQRRVDVAAQQSLVGPVGLGFSHQGGHDVVRVRVLVGGVGPEPQRLIRYVRDQPLRGEAPKRVGTQVGQILGALGVVWESAPMVESLTQGDRPPGPPADPEAARRSCRRARAGRGSRARAPQPRCMPSRCSPAACGRRPASGGCSRDRRPRHGAQRSFPRAVRARSHPVVPPWSPPPSPTLGRAPDRPARGERRPPAIPAPGSGQWQPEQQCRQIGLATSADHRAAAVPVSSSTPTPSGSQRSARRISPGAAAKSRSMVSRLS